MKLEFSWRIFENSVQLSKFHDSNSSGSRVVPYGRTDRQTDMIEVNSRFSQVCEHAKKNLHSAHRVYLYVMYSFAQQAVSIFVNNTQRLVVSRGIVSFEVETTLSDITLMNCRL